MIKILARFAHRQYPAAMTHLDLANRRWKLAKPKLFAVMAVTVFLGTVTNLDKDHDIVVQRGWDKIAVAPGERGGALHGVLGIAAESLLERGVSQRPLRGGPVTGKVRCVIAGDVLELNTLETSGGVAKIIFDQVKKPAVQVERGPLVGLALEPLDLFAGELTLGPAGIGLAEIQRFDVADGLVESAGGEILAAGMQCRETRAHGVETFVLRAFGVEGAVVGTKLKRDLLVDQACLGRGEGRGCNGPAGGRYRAATGAADREAKANQQETSGNQRVAELPAAHRPMR